MSGPRVRSIALRNLSRFNHLELTFNDRFNLICRTNGIGKSTILNSIASSFVGNRVLEELRRNANAEEGSISAEITHNGDTYRPSGAVKAFEPGERVTPFGIAELAPYLLYLQPNRDFAYVSLSAIAKDDVTGRKEAEARALHGVTTGSIKNWLANRWLFQPRSEFWPPYQVSNFATAVACFSILDPEIRLSHVNTATYEVMVDTPSGLIPFEYLSSGFRVSYAVLLGLIKEIETRDVERSAADFPGIILIDELDLHLHPTWQQRFPSAIRTVFPKAQIIATTHSPHMVQTAGPGEVIAIVEGPDGWPMVATDQSTEYGYVGWTVDEILTNVMGVEDARSTEYRAAILYFDEALDREDVEAAAGALATLEVMLHPNSNLKKLLRLQAAGLGVKIDPTPQTS